MKLQCLFLLVGAVALISVPATTVEALVAVSEDDYGHDQGALDDSDYVADDRDSSDDGEIYGEGYDDNDDSNESVDEHDRHKGHHRNGIRGRKDVDGFTFGHHDLRPGMGHLPSRNRFKRDDDESHDSQDSHDGDSEDSHDGKPIGPGFGLSTSPWKRHGKPGGSKFSHRGQEGDGSLVAGPMHDDEACQCEGDEYSFENLSPWCDRKCSIERCEKECPSDDGGDKCKTKCKPVPKLNHSKRFFHRGRGVHGNGNEEEADPTPAPTPCNETST